MNHLSLAGYFPLIYQQHLSDTAALRFPVHQALCSVATPSVNSGELCLCALAV